MALLIAMKINERVLCEYLMLKLSPCIIWRWSLNGSLVKPGSNCGDVATLLSQKYIGISTLQSEFLCKDTA